MKNRIDSIDIAKGIAIIFVVLGHSIQSFGNEEMNLLNKVIYSFHMPLFFVLTGVTFKYDLSFDKFTKKKIKSLIKPYFTYATVTFVYKMLLGIIKGENILYEIKDGVLGTVFLSSESYFYNLWFLPCLFTVCIIAYFVFGKTKNNIIRGGVCIVASALALLVQVKFNLALPLCFEVACVALSWLFLGNLIKQIFMRKKTTLYIGMGIVSMIILSVTNIVSYYVFDYQMSDSYRQLIFPNIVFSVITGISGTIMVLCIGTLIHKNRILEYIGRDSCSVYGLHFLFLGLLGKMIEKVDVLLETPLAAVFLGTALNIVLVLGLKKIFQIVRNWLYIKITKE